VSQAVVEGECFGHCSPRLSREVQIVAILSEMPRCSLEHVLVSSPPPNTYSNRILVRYFEPIFWYYGIEFLVTGMRSHDCFGIPVDICIGKWNFRNSLGDESPINMHDQVLGWGRAGVLKTDWDDQRGMRTLVSAHTKVTLAHIREYESPLNRNESISRGFGYSLRSVGLVLHSVCEVASPVRLIGKLLQLLSIKADHLIGLFGTSLHLTELPTHNFQLIPVNPSNPNSNSKSSNLNCGFPPWRLIWAACSGFSLMWLGWHGLRTGRKGSGWYFCALLLGCVLWGYSCNGWINWRLPIIHTISPLHTTNCIPQNSGHGARRVGGLHHVEIVAVDKVSLVSADIRVTSDELRMIESAAKDSGQTRSEFIRGKLLATTGG